jgi:NADP-dependent 3-hydroxy acid dehydrogenase YdfG/acyl carrier protein
VLIECSPHPVLVPGVDGMPAVGTLRRGEGGPERLHKSFAEAYAAGVDVDWRRVLAGAGRRVPLPTYAFVHERYWLEAGADTDVSSAGLDTVDHAILSAAVPLAASDGHVFTARISTATHSWLAGHKVQGAIVVPGTALLEMAVRAGAEAGVPYVEELVIAAPLILDPAGDLQVQVTVGEAAEDGRRPLTVHARSGTDDWTRHAAGTLTAEPPPGPDTDLAEWPPHGADGADVSELYPDLAAIGLSYGPAFQGVRAAWRRGPEIFAEIEPRAELETAGYALHPALLDAALHPIGLAGELSAPKLPFSWSGVVAHQTGAAALRVRITPTAADSFAVLATDPFGTPVFAAASLVVRPMAPASGDHLYRLARTELAPRAEPLPFAVVAAVPDVAHPAPPVVFTILDPAPATEARVVTVRTLGLIQAWLADERLTAIRLVFVTREGDLAGAAATGLVRSAQSEHPGRFQLAEVDTEPVAEILSTLSGYDEPQLTLRAGVVSAPRLIRVTEAPEAPPWKRDSTVLVTGGTGLLGGLVARHLAGIHGVRRLVLASRSGPAADGAADLVAELKALGADAVIVAADLSDRRAVAGLLDAHPVTAVVHAAGVLDDGLVEALTPDRIDTVFRAKTDPAVHLHELTLATDLDAFVLFSSAAGVLGAAGQGNYAAANALLDALAGQRRAAGRVATSIAWGMWEQTSALTAALSEGNRRRMTASGVVPLTSAEGVAVLDAAVALDDAVLIGAHFDLPVLRRRAETVPAAPPLRDLVAVPVRRERGGGPARESLRRRIERAPVAQREQLVVAAVLAETAGVLGHRAGDQLSASREFKDLGFDSLTAVELRNRLRAITGLNLPASLVFDYPSPRALTAFLLGELAPAEEEAAVEDAGIRATLAAIPLDALRDSGLLNRLLQLAGTVPAGTVPAGRPTDQIDSMDAEALIAMVNGGDS